MASITCGNCKGTHETVVQVKRCHGTSYFGREMTLVDYLTAMPVFCVDCGVRNTSHQNAAGTVGRYSADELHPDACAKVQEELEMAPAMPGADVMAVGTWAAWVEMYRAHQAQDVPGLPGVTVAAARTLAPRDDWGRAHYRTEANLRAATGTPTTRDYGRVKGLRRELAGELAQLMPGHDKFRVAVQLSGENKVRFFRVDAPQRGKWAGAVFLKEQAGDDLYPVKPVAREENIINALLGNVKAALKRYGLELGSCGICGRTLTDEESRALGIGPVCAAKAMGW